MESYALSRPLHDLDASTNHRMDRCEDQACRKADLHLHSSRSHDVPDLPQLSPLALYQKAVAAGMDYFVLTDHDTMKGVRDLRRQLWRRYGDHPPIPVIPGVELKIRDRRIGHTVHVNVLGLSIHQFRELGRRRTSVDRFLAYCRAERLYHAYNHPFWFERGERGDLAAILELIRRFPVVEINAGRIPSVNARTAKLAARCGRALVANSDSHTGRVGRAHTIAPGETAEAFLANIMRGNSRMVADHLVMRGFIDEITGMIDLVFGGTPAFRFKRTLLKEAPAARALARGLMGTRRVLGKRLFRRTIRTVMRVLAHGPAYIYILSQRWMNLRIGRAEDRLRVLAELEPPVAPEAAEPPAFLPRVA